MCAQRKNPQNNLEEGDLPPHVPIRDDVTSEEVDDDDVTPTGSLERRKDATMVRHPAVENSNVNLL